MIFDPWTDVPKPSLWWVNSTESERLARLNAIIGSEVRAVEARVDGLVTVELPVLMKADARGTLLRKVEATCKANIDPAIVIVLKPALDRNPLRKLRGVIIK